MKPVVEPVVEPVMKPVVEPKPENIVMEIKKKKNVTRKVKKDKPTTCAIENVDYVELFKKNGIKVLDNLTEADLSKMIESANNAFHCIGKPIMSDNEYDILHEYVEKKFPKNAVLEEVGAPVEKNKVKLPYEMASMDKIKPDTGILSNWMSKYKGPYVLSCKLDGVSGMYTTEGPVPKLYTRGDGKIGQDISHLIPKLRLPKDKGIVVRGEFIIPKEIFKTKYETKFANPRNMVAGIVNQKKVDEKIKDIHFVAYEVIIPENLTPSQQMAKLESMDIEVVKNIKMSADSMSNEALSEVLQDLRSSYIYEIDGIIVADDNVHKRESGNPKHAFAFKMVLSDQIAEAHVVDVLWTASKDGYLKPRVQIMPVKLGGVTIQYATGFNGAFIEQNKIGVGAIIQIIRSGDVIPYIKAVTTPATQPKMPDVDYIWNDTHIDILLENTEDDKTVLEKNIAGFFKGIEVDGLGPGNVVKLIESGFNSVPKILHMTKNDFLKVEGFKERTATKLLEGIREKIEKASLSSIMAASNLMGRGFSDKKIELILEEYPTVLRDSERDVNRVSAIKGMAKKSAETFVKNIPLFIEFMKECGLEQKLNMKSPEAAMNHKKEIDESHILYKKSIVMTGFRDKELEEKLKTVGAKVSSSVSKNTFVLLTKNKDESTGKIEDAKKNGVPIMTPEEFSQKYLE